MLTHAHIFTEQIIWAEIHTHKPLEAHANTDRQAHIVNIFIVIYKLTKREEKNSLNFALSTLWQIAVCCCHYRPLFFFLIKSKLKW